MRLFLAVDLDEKARETASAEIVSLARALEATGMTRAVRWIPGPNLHLTIRFIGEADDEAYRRLRERLSEPISEPPFDVTFDGAGAFPPSGRPRIIWIGVTGGRTELGAISAAIERRVQEAGFAPETRPFSAHLTIGRVKELRRREAETMVRTLAAWTSTTFRVHVDRVTLYRSFQRPSGSEYEAQLSVPLQSGDWRQAPRG